MIKLKAEISSCSIEPDALLIDGGRMLHKLHWPTDGLVEDLVGSCHQRICAYIQEQPSGAWYIWSQVNSVIDSQIMHPLSNL